MVEEVGSEVSDIQVGDRVAWYFVYGSYAEQLVAPADQLVPLPDDIDFTLEMVVGRMIGLLLIEISAFHGFGWAEQVLGDVQALSGMRKMQILGDRHEHPQLA